MSEPSPAVPEPNEKAGHVSLSVEQQMEEIMASSTNVSPFEMAMAENITGDHITEMLGIKRLQEENKHKDSVGERFGLIVALCVITVFVLALVWVALSFKTPEIIVPIITAIVGAMGGALGGFGYGRSTAAKAKN